MKNQKTVQSAASAEAQWRAAKSAVGVAEREVKSVRAKARQAKAQFKIAKKTVKLARKAVKAAKAKLRAARKSLRKLQGATIAPPKKKTVALKSAAEKLKATAAKSKRASRSHQRKPPSSPVSRKARFAEGNVALDSALAAEVNRPDEIPQFESADAPPSAPVTPTPGEPAA